MKKLSIGHKHIMKLISRDKNNDGWTPVGDKLYPHLVKHMPKELVEFSGSVGSYKDRLTDKGNNILEAMAWL